MPSAHCVCMVKEDGRNCVLQHKSFKQDAAMLHLVGDLESMTFKTAQSSSNKNLLYTFENRGKLSDGYSKKQVKSSLLSGYEDIAVHACAILHQPIP